MNKSALILIDLQYDYFANGAHPLFESDKAVFQAGKILRLFRQKEQTIFHIQHIAERAGSTFFLPGTKGVEIHHEVAPLNNEILIVKHFPNSFRETSLLTQLRAMNISNLVFCGMMTHMCVDATTRAARDYGFNCTLIGDACATRDLQIFENTVKATDVHHAFLAALNGFYATVVNTSSFTL